MAGLSRDEIVFLNRMEHEYKQDKLPNEEQIRYDNGRLVGIIARLTEELGKMSREKE